MITTTANKRDLNRGWSERVQAASVVECFWLCEVLFGRPATERFKAIRRMFLNRACDLACQPIHLRLAEIANGSLVDCWYSYAYVATPNGRSQIESVFLGYADQMNEDQARARAMGY